MPGLSEKGGQPGHASDIGRSWLGNSIWQAPELKISGIKTWALITAVTYHRSGGETIWRGARHRIAMTLDQLPWNIVQVEKGRARQTPAAPGTLAFFPAGLTVRAVHPAARLTQVLWDVDLYSVLLPEFGAAASWFEVLFPLQDPLLSQIVTSLADELEDGFADRILVESLGTALCIRLAQRFVGRLPLPTRNQGLSPERLQRVRDYIEAHLDDELSLTLLADVACLSPYHFSRSFKRATGVGPQRYVIQRRLERAKRLLRHTHQPLARIAQESGFTDQSHLSSIFRRELGVTPGRFRAAIA